MCMTSRIVTPIAVCCLTPSYTTSTPMTTMIGRNSRLRNNWITVIGIATMPSRPYLGRNSIPRFFHITWRLPNIQRCAA